MCGKSLLCLTEIDNVKKKKREVEIGRKRSEVIKENVCVNEKETDGGVNVQGAEVVKVVGSVGVTEGC